jgi:hypothetical protein
MRDKGTVQPDMRKPCLYVAAVGGIRVKALSARYLYGGVA